MLLYPANLRADGDTYVVLFPVPNTHTNGNSTGSARSHAPAALQTGLSLLMEKNLPIPVPSPGKGKRSFLVGLPSLVADAKVELYMALRASGIRKAELARRLGIHKQQVERLLNLDHASRIEQLESAFAALGKQLKVEVHDVAA